MNNKGAILKDLKRYEEAIEFYNKSIEIEPDSYITWYNKGKALWALGRNEEAVKAFGKASEIEVKTVKSSIIGKND